MQRIPQDCQNMHGILCRRTIPPDSPIAHPASERGYDVRNVCLFERIHSHPQATIKLLLGISPVVKQSFGAESHLWSMFECIEAHPEPTWIKFLWLHLYIALPALRAAFKPMCNEAVFALAYPWMVSGFIDLNQSHPPRLEAESELITGWMEKIWAPLAKADIATLMNVRNPNYMSMYIAELISWGYEALCAVGLPPEPQTIISFKFGGAPRDPDLHSGQNRLQMHERAMADMGHSPDKTLLARSQIMDGREVSSNTRRWVFVHPPKTVGKRRNRSDSVTGGIGGTEGTKKGPD